MLFGGEDPLYILRRLVRFAVEDIGLADPQAMAVALHAKETYEFIGSPEGDLALAETVIYLASAPKSNRVYSAFNRVMKEVKDSPQEPVPLQLRNAPTRLMQEAGYGQGYQYAHDHESLTTVMGTLPDKLQGKRYYFPGNLGFEKEIQKRMDWWQSIKDKIRRENSESQSKNRKKT
jgi:putative ATPase